MNAPDNASRADRARYSIAAHVALVVAVVVLAIVSIRSVLAANEGEPSVPLDDSYIHFQFARSFAHLHPFVYTQGAQAVPGASSLLWPALLAPFFWLGLDGSSIIWPAWALGFAALGLAAREAALLSKGLLSPWVALSTGAMVLCFGGLVWAAASGMEGAPFAFVLLRSLRRLGEWCERDQPGLRDGLARELLVLGVLAPLMRPEGAVVSVVIAVAFLHRVRGHERALGAIPLVGVFLPTALYWLGTSEPSSTTRQVKWLLANPYLSTGEVARQVASNLSTLYLTIFNGEVWSATVLPRGGAPLAWLAMPALAFRSWQTKRYWRGGLVGLGMACMWLPTTYDTFLWNRLRYLWPFAPAWFIAVGAVCDVVADAAAHYRERLGWLRLALAALVVASLAQQLPLAVADLADSSRAIRAQQVSLGRWARAHLPDDARIGVNDTGAIAYFSNRQTFDIVGLTTVGEAEYWLAGRGSRFEHYERLDQTQLPTHFIVYPSWFGLQPLLGDYLTERYVDATILGGTRMVAHVADYSLLKSAELPSEFAPAAPLVDRLDVADLQSERAHAYELFQAEQVDNQLVSHRWFADGARHSRTRERFRLRLAPGGTLVARLGSDRPLTLAVRVDGQSIGTLKLQALPWQEVALRLPATVEQGERILTLSSPSGPFSALYYWSYGVRSNDG